MGDEITKYNDRPTFKTVADGSPPAQNLIVEAIQITVEEKGKLLNDLKELLDDQNKLHNRFSKLQVNLEKKQETLKILTTGTQLEREQRAKQVIEMKCLKDI